MYGSQWEGIMSNLVKVVESEQMMRFDPCNIIVSHNEDVPSNWSFDEFPKTRTESTSVMFPSVAESLLSSSSAESHSSSEKYSDEFPSSYNSSEKHTSDDHIHHDPAAATMSFSDQFPQEHHNLLRVDAVIDQKPLDISFQRNQMVSFTITKAEKQCRRGVACCGVSTTRCSNSGRRGAAASKRRIRWTKDLHDSFMIIVNRLGGPDKAKPKAILEMMKSNLLSISHIKSHLQKCRTTIYQHKALHERSGEEGHKTDEVTELQLKIHMQIEESRQLQLEVKRSIHEQLEMQQNLQVLIEQEREHLKIMLDQQKEGTKLGNM